MMDEQAVSLALRGRALTLSVCTTGAQSLSATTTGYARAAGSFVTDGIVVGAEILASGFATAANNGHGVVKSVTAGAIEMESTYTVALTPTGYTVTPRVLATEAAAAGRTISIGLPALRAFENVSFTPFAGKPYIEEDFVPATGTVFSAPASGGEMVEDGLYFIKWYGLSGKGTAALRKGSGALKALFTPGTKMTAGSHTVRTIPENAAKTGRILPLDTGWSVLILTVPWQVYSNNSIAP